MQRRLVVTVLLGLGLTGVFGAGAGSTATPSLSQRVLRSNELPGFVADRIQTLTTAEEWAKVAPGALVDVAARLRHEGFSGAAREDLRAGSSDRGALSLVVRLGSPAAAVHELGLQRRDYASESHRLHGHTTAPFSVPSIPGAYGYTATDASGAFGVNVIFADGRFVYHVGAGWSQRASDPPTKAKVVAAALHLYERVHSR